MVYPFRAADKRVCASLLSKTTISRPFLGSRAGAEVLYFSERVCDRLFHETKLAVLLLGTRMQRGGQASGQHLGLIGWALGIDPSLLIGGAEILSDSGSSVQASGTRAPRSGTSSSNEAEPNALQDRTGQFVSAVLGETEDRWQEIFRSQGDTYRPPKLVLFSSVTRSACGTAQSATGPFYCPSDLRVYLDIAFFREIETRFGGCAAGRNGCQFAQAYVITHEIGHHVRNLLGILRKVHDMQASVDRARAGRDNAITSAGRLKMRGGIATICIGVLAAFPAAAKQDSIYQYRIEHPAYGDIGTYTNIVETAGSETKVISELHVAVKLIGMVVYRQDANRMERWSKDRLISFDGTTTTNGKAVRVVGEATGDHFTITSPDGTTNAPANVRPSNPWSMALLKSNTIMSTKTGRVFNAHISSAPEGPGVGKTPLKYEVISDKRELIRFDERGIPVEFSTEDDGTRINFSLVQAR